MRGPREKTTSNPRLATARPKGDTANKPRNGSLAQSVEHLTFNQVVAGSIPARPTNLIDPPPLNWSTLYHRNGRVEYEYEAT